MPLILAEQVGQRQVIAAACPAARGLGLVPGMAVTQARALVSNLEIRPADPAADQVLLGSLTLHAVLVGEIVLTPGDGVLQIDVRGDLAGILAVSLKRERPAVLRAGRSQG